MQYGNVGPYIEGSSWGRRGHDPIARNSFIFIPAFLLHPRRHLATSSVRWTLIASCPESFVASGRGESSSKNDRTRERSCHESVKNLNFQKEISILWPRFDELRLFLYFPFPFDEYFASWFKISEKNILVDIWMVFYWSW